MVKCVVNSTRSEEVSVVRTYKDTIKGSINCECCGENRYNIQIEITYTSDGINKGKVDEISFHFYNYGSVHVYKANDRFQILLNNFIPSLVDTELNLAEKESTRRDISVFIIETILDHLRKKGVRHPDAY